MPRKKAEVPDARHLLEIKTIENKGLGIFAKVDIPRRTTVVSEVPLCLADGDFKPAHVLRAFSRLPRAKKQAYLKLHDWMSREVRQGVEEDIGLSWRKIPEQHRRVLSIFTANNWGHEDVCIFGSRFNHSCKPNVRPCTEPRDRRGTRNAAFETKVDIKAGEELTVSYIGLHGQSKERRRARLLKHWGFRCRCPKCEAE